MHIYNSLKNFLYDQEHFIAYFNNQIYIYNFDKIITLTSTIIKLQIIDYYIEINGTNLEIKKSINNELLIKGNIESIIKK